MLLEALAICQYFQRCSLKSSFDVAGSFVLQYIHRYLNQVTVMLLEALAICQYVQRSRFHLHQSTVMLLEAFAISNMFSDIVKT